jgi:hypothetical protein
MELPRSQKINDLSEFQDRDHQETRDLDVPLLLPKLVSD